MALQQGAVALALRASMALALAEATAQESPTPHGTPPPCGAVTEVHEGGAE